jgi:signal transduction histidine kinase
MALRSEQLVSRRQWWNRTLLVAAMVIVVATLWYSNSIADRIRQEEQSRVRVWSEAIRQRAELVRYTQALFEELSAEEREKADRLADAYRLVDNPPEGMDLTFITEFLWANKTIPVLIVDNEGNELYAVNIASGVDRDSLRAAMKASHAPIVFQEVGHSVYWSESTRFNELKSTMQELINSFISETVMNSASVPVVLMNENRENLLRYQGVDSADVAEPGRLQKLLADMESTNDPIAIELPDGLHYIYFADSAVLTQLQYFPFVQLTLIAVFLLTAYMIFSSFRRSEQDQIWVGMAKETAHQLGTPLSSLMAWTGLLEGIDDVPRDYLVEMNRDIERLNVVVDRFSKIGSKPELKPQVVADIIESTVTYMRPRISSKIELTFDVEAGARGLQAPLSPSLFSWVLENLIRNAVDAMDGSGSIALQLRLKAGGGLSLLVRDTGKGIPKARWKEVFAPGYTTKSRGWGLGLSLVKRIMEDYHGGKIAVLDSQVGVGSTFEVEFLDEEMKVR